MMKSLTHLDVKLAALMLKKTHPDSLATACALSFKKLQELNRNIK